MVVVVDVVEVVDVVVVTLGRVVGFCTTTVAGTVVVVVVVVTTGVHCAYKVTGRAGMVNDALMSYEVPEPSCAVFQRANVKLERVTDAADTVTADENWTLCEVGRDPVPPLAS